MLPEILFQKRFLPFLLIFLTSLSVIAQDLVFESSFERERIIHRVKIGPAGGDIVSLDGRLTLRLPAGALAKDIEFTIERVDGPGGSDGPVYEVGPAGTQFLLPVRVTYSLYGLNPMEPKVATYEGGAWNALAGQYLDSFNNEVSGDTMHLSLFSMVDTAPEPVPICGDLACFGGETCSSCPKDCGVCAQCGNLTCEETEDCQSCESDCGVCIDTDGDGTFDHLDNCAFEANDNQNDADGDGFGDICDRPQTPFGIWPESHPVGRAPLLPFPVAPAYDWMPTDDIFESFPESGQTHSCSGQMLSVSSGEPTWCTYDTCVASFAPGQFASYVTVRALADDDKGILFLSSGLFTDNPGVRVLTLDIGDDYLKVAQDISLDFTLLHATFDLPGEIVHFVVDNAALSRTDDGRDHVVISGRHGFRPPGADEFTTHHLPVVVGLTPGTFEIQWAMKVGRVIEREATESPMNLIVFEDGRIVTALDAPEDENPYDLEIFRNSRDVYTTRVPANGVFGSMRKVSPLTTSNGTNFRVRVLSRDDEGHLFVLGSDPVVANPENCGYVRDVGMIRVYDEAFSLVDERDIDMPFEQAVYLFVTPETAPDGTAETVARIIGEPATDNSRIKDHYYKDPTQFSQNPNDPVRCPEEFRSVCEPLTEACPCRNCSGGSYTTTLGDGRRQKRTRLVQVTYTGGENLSYVRTRAFDFSPMRDFPNPGEMAFDGKGKLMTLTGLYDTRALTPQTQQVFEKFGGYSELPVAGKPYPDSDSFFFDAPEDASEGRFVGVTRHSRGHRDLVVGRSGSNTQFLSRTPGSDFYTGDYNLAAWVLPLPNGRLLWVAEQTEKIVIQLARPVDAIPDDVLLPPAMEAMPVVGPSTRNGLGIIATEDADVADWIYCITYIATTGERPVCDLQEIQREWEKQKEEDVAIAISVGSGERGSVDGALFNDRLEDAVKIECASTETRPRSLGSTYGFEFRCPSWEEIYEAGAGTSTVGLDIISAQSVPHGLVEGVCSFQGNAAPMRGFLVYGKAFDVIVTDSLGTTVASAEVGDQLTVCTEDVTDASFITMQVVEGPAVLEGQDGQAQVVLRPWECAELTVTGEGVIVIEITAVDANGVSGDSVRSVIFVDGPQMCSFDPDGSFSSCNLRLPIDIPEDATVFESLQSPSVAGAGVLLHDRSFSHQHTDLEVPSIGMPVQFSRTYRSAHIPNEGGLLGGWTLSYDQRLMQFTAADRTDPLSCRSDPAEQGPASNVAFYDGTGRIDVFPSPDSVDVVTVDFSDTQDAADAYLTYDHQLDQVVKRNFRAQVATFGKAAGRFETLKVYTLLDTADEDLSNTHPWYVDHNDESGAIGKFESRFYELTEPGGTRKIFNCRGQLARIIDPRFHDMEFLYNGGSHPLELTKLLSTVIDTSGRRFELKWDNLGPTGRSYPRLTGITDPFGREILYNYRSDGDTGALLESATFSAEASPDEAHHVEQVWKYEYDTAGRLVTMTRADGELELTNVYNPAGEITRQVFGSGTPTQGPEATTSFAIDFEESAAGVRVTDGRGVEWDYTLGASSGDGPTVTKALSWQTEVFNGNLMNPDTTMTTAERQWTHDADGLVLTYLAESGVLTTFGYNAKGTKVSRSITPANGDGETLSWAYEVEPDCQTVRRLVDPAGRVSVWTGPTELDITRPGLRCRAQSLVRETLVASPDDIAAKVQWSDTFVFVESGPARGLLSRHTVLRDNVMEREFELEFGGIAVSQSPVSPSGKLLRPRAGHVLTRTHRGATPAICTADLPSQVKTTYETDLRGNVVEQRILNLSGDIVITRSFDEADRLVEEIQDPDGHAVTTTTAYDLNNQVTAITQQLRDNFSEPSSIPPGPTGVISERRHYDSLGRHFATYISGTGGNQWFAVSGLDANGAVVERLTPGPGITQSRALAIGEALNGRLGFSEIVASHPVLNNSSNFIMDQGPELVYETITRDVAGYELLVRVTDGLGLRTDQTNLVLDPYLHTIESKAYRDIAGNVVFEDSGRTDRSTFRTNSYNGHQWLVSEKVYDESCASGDVLLEIRRENFDVDGNPAILRTLGTRGYVASPTDPPPGVCEPPVDLALQDLEYDAWGRLFQVTETNRPQVPSLANDLVDFHLSEFRTTTMTYDDQGRERLRVRGDATSHVAYTFFDQVCGETESITAPTPSAEIKTYAFDERTQRTSIREQHQRQGNTVLDLTLDFTVDALGRVTSRTDDTFMTTRFFYDSLDRLRAELSPRFETPYSDNRTGQFEIRSYDALGNVTSKDHRVITIQDGIAAKRSQTYDYRSSFITEVRDSVEGSVRDTTSYVGDVVGNQAKVFPHGRGFNEDYVTFAFNESGHLLHEGRITGTSVAHTVDALGRTVQTVATPPTIFGPGYEDAVELTHLSRFNSLGARVYARQNSTVNTNNIVVWRRDAFGNALEEESTNGGLIRARYDNLGNRVDLFFPGAPVDGPHVSFENDALGRVRRASTFRVDDSFGALDDIELDYSGGVLTEKRVRTGAGELFTSTYGYNELGDRHRVTHYRGSVTPGNRFLESRAYYYGPDLAGNATYVVYNGQEQGQGTQLFDDVRQGDLVSHLSSWPGSATDLVNFQVFPGNPWPSVYRIMERGPFGDVERQETISWRPVSGRASIEFKWNEYDGMRLAEEQSISWLGENDAGFFSDGKIQDWRFTALTPEGNAGRYKDRTVSKVHRSLSDPPDQDPGRYPKSATYDGLATIESERTYRIDWTRENKMGAYGLDFDVDTLGVGIPLNVFNYDALDRLISVEDLQSAAFQNNGVPQLQPERMHEFEVLYDALGRRNIEFFQPEPAVGPGGSKLPTEKKRNFNYLDNLTLEEENVLSTGGELTDRFLPIEDQLPYADLHFGEHILFEDIQGGFAGLYDVDKTQFSALTMASSEEVALKAQPYVVTEQAQSEAFDPGILDFLTNALMMPFPQVPEGQTFFRRTSPNSEEQPFFAMSYSPSAGFQMRLMEHPHYAQEMQRLSLIQANQAVWVGGLLIAASSVVPVVPGILGNILWGALITYDVYQAALLAEEVRYNGWTSNSALSAFSLGLSVSASGVSVLSRSQPKTTMLPSRAAKIALSQERLPGVISRLKTSRTSGRDWLANRRYQAREAWAPRAKRLADWRAKQRLMTRVFPSGQALAHDSSRLGIEYQFSQGNFDLVNRHLRHAFRDASRARVALIGKDTITDRLGRAGTHPEFARILDRVTRSYGGQVSSIKSFMSEIRPPGGLRKYLSLWSPHVNLAWVEGIAHGRTPVVLTSPLSEFRKPRLWGMSFMEREYLMLIQRGYRYVPTPGTSNVHGMLIPPVLR